VTRMDDQDGLKLTIAIVRMCVGIIFLLFGWYKVAGPAFAHGGIQHYVQGFLDRNMVVSFYRPFLEKVALPHALFLGYGVGVVELLIGLSLVSGILVRIAATGGAFYMVNFLLSEWNGPGANAPTWQYFGAQLDHLGLLFLFLIFFADNASRLSLQRLLTRSPKSA